MAGNSPGEAVTAFLTPIKNAVSCLCSATVQYRDNPPLNIAQTVVLNNGEPIRLESSVYDSVYIEITLGYVAIEEEGERGPYRCSSRAYFMQISDDAQKELISFHWHPIGVSPEVGPHFHVGEAQIRQAARLHVPTPRVAVEEFIRVAIETFGVATTVDRDVWEPLLADSQEVHETWRSWSERSDAPRFPEST